VKRFPAFVLCLALAAPLQYLPAAQSSATDSPALPPSAPKQKEPQLKGSHLTQDEVLIAGRVTPNSLRAHVSFLASDLLEGRDTPSRGLDIAGEYIASEFERMGLEPAGESGYFETVVVKPEDPNSPRSRNVIAILRGSDPVLKNTYVMLTAHYDHLGLAASGEDRVFNGANDNASGTASVLEVANALAALPTRPKRSVLFVLFCGEEKGLRGSRYYAAHPLFALAQTVAMVNLEQMGRTDSTEGRRIKSANVTGFDFSSVTQILVNAGKQAGIAVTKVPGASDDYFNRSDNGPLARAGVPAHTISVTYEFPDYHAVGDESQKIDYDNMAQVDRGVAFAILKLASASKPPKWNEDYPAAKRYADAGKKLYAK
jgi:Peptidase family M28